MPAVAVPAIIACKGTALTTDPSGNKYLFEFDLIKDKDVKIIKHLGLAGKGKLVIKFTYKYPATKLNIDEYKDWISKKESTKKANKDKYEHCNVTNTDDNIDDDDDDRNDDRNDSRPNVQQCAQQ